MFVYVSTTATADRARAFAATCVFAFEEPETLIEISGAGWACFVFETPGIGRAVVLPRSFDGRMPASAAAFRIVSSLVTNAVTRPSVVGGVVTGLALSGASGWPR